MHKTYANTRPDDTHHQRKRKKHTNNTESQLIILIFRVYSVPPPPVDTPVSQSVGVVAPAVLVVSVGLVNQARPVRGDLALPINGAAHPHRLDAKQEAVP